MLSNHPRRFLWPLLLAAVFSCAGTALSLQQGPRSAAAAPEPLSFIGDVFARVAPAVVYIESAVAGSTDDGEAVLLLGGGSGFFISEQGYLVTNQHVIDGAAQIRVVLADGRQDTAEVVAAVPDADLALLRVSLRDVPVVRLAATDTVAVGSLVFAIGNPGGEQFARSMTMGIVSGLDRQLVLADGNLYRLLQTDAAINPGNSGGPLVDSEGRVVGVNSVKIVDAEFEGMGFAIPVDTVRETLGALCPAAFE